MSTHRFLGASAIAAAFAASSIVAFAAPAAELPNLGKPVTPDDLKAWDITIFPDGTNLPAGSGTSVQGAPIFAAKCAACHGENATGGVGGALTPGPARATLDGGKSIANFWPYSTTIFDFIRRAMPYNAPHSLTDNEVYALTAYLLNLNRLIGPSDVMNKDTLPKVRLPNEGNFIIRFPERI